MSASKDTQLNGFEPVGNLGDFDSLLGPYLVKQTDDNSALCAFTPDKRHTSFSGALHKGALTAFAEFALCRTAENLAGGDSDLMAFTSEFISSGQQGEAVIGTASCTRVTKNVIFLKGQLCSGDDILLTFTGIASRQAS